MISYSYTHNFWRDWLNITFYRSFNAFLNPFQESWKVFRKFVHLFACPNTPPFKIIHIFVHKDFSKLGILCLFCGCLDPKKWKNVLKICVYIWNIKNDAIFEMQTFHFSKKGIHIRLWFSRFLLHFWFLARLAKGYILQEL